MRSFAQLSDEIEHRFETGRGFALATLNLDHLVKIGADPTFAEAYARQDLVVADGRPVAWLARLAGRPVELMPGSDMIVPLCRLAAGAGVSVALVGSDDETLAGAAAALEDRVPGLRIAWRHAPPMGFDPDGPAAERLLVDIAGQGIGLCFVALGAPKQERLAARGRHRAPGVGFACIGAGLDFLAGRQRRAPPWMRRLALEWLWRLGGDVRRLGPRYARCFAILPGQIARAARQRFVTPR
ncbi:WecB/TagA/CpsF family glycosyltransferase [Roseovarius salinarum]|uniref:WecB/TagA/CpsF family glycosyltransferase n=1 Tax=Roseovarius salinarum TaxID=1981892 RepID=UPI000C334BB3|nr:WecB/TagA/CpsF family glycosyltransferase [Roseovarius salinarum]